MQHQGCVVGLDMGTTTVKAVAFDLGGRELAKAAVNLELSHDTAGAAEQDPAVVYDALVGVLEQTARQAHQLGYVVDHVGLSAAMHSVIPVAEDGTPLGHALLWMDMRARAQAEALWASQAGQGIYERTGTPVHAMAPLAKLLWMRQHRPDLFAAARFVSLKEWVWHRWFGAWQVDASIASATGLYNLRTGTWDDEALRLAQIEPGRLSTLVPTTFTRRDIRESRLIQAGMTPETSWNIGASDGVLANLGVGAIDTEQLVLTIGTSLAVRTGSAQTFADPPMRLFCYVLDAGRYIVGGPSNSGGVILDWLYRNIVGGPGIDPEAEPLPAAFVELLGAAESAHDSELLFLPYVAGERAPLWQADATGVLYGLQLQHTGAHIMRAAIEGIIFNAYWIASRLFERLGKPQAIVATGKVLETAWVRQLTADVFGIPVQYLGNIDASVTGAAALANIATGVWRWEEAAHRLRGAHGEIARPGDGRSYQAQYERYRRLSAALLERMGAV